MNFDVKDLKKFLAYLGKNYKVAALKDWKKNSDLVILRHDIELDIKDAHELFKLEKHINIKSTFLVLTTCDTYNAFSFENRQMLKEIADNGFEIGLHFDPTVYPEASLAELQKFAQTEAEMLTRITRKKIVSISQHRPKASGDRFIMFKGFINAYDPKIFSPDAYISDSRMTFRKNPYQFVANSKKPIQVLIHPDHFLKKGRNYPEKLANYTWEFAEKLDKNFRPVSTYRKLIGRKKLSHYMKEQIKGKK